jgi:hypothetical protein
MKPPALGWQLLLAFGLSLLVLTGLIGWLQNVHIVTTNGMYKSIQVEPWIADPAHAVLDASNYLYFPLYGRLCALLDATGILRGVAWKQLAYLNALWASVGSVLVYAFAHRLTRSAVAAAAATVFHLGTGFVLLLSVISEDIMPGYVVTLASMMLAALWFDRPTVRQVAIVGAVFTLGWLIEWRLIFPTLPAFLLALAISKGSLRERAIRIGTLLATIVATTTIVQLPWIGHPGSAGVLGLLWTGKGVDTGWGGFALDKLWLMLSGVSSYFLMDEVPFSAGSARKYAGELAIPVFLELIILAVCAILLWNRRRDRRLWAIAAVFLGTLGAGEVFNLYAQPHDPQMQINVMVWLTVAWTLLLGTVMAATGALPLLVVLSFVPLAWNTAYLAANRGRDAQSVAALSAIEKNFPAEFTVFVYWGFEPITMWHFALWSHTWDWDIAGPAPPAPSKVPRFKWIAIDAGAIRHPRWTAEQDAQAIKHDIDYALDNGYRVVISDVWSWSAGELANQLGTLSAADRAVAIHDMLHRSYSAGPAVHVPGAGNYFELRPR